MAKKTERKPNYYKDIEFLIELGIHLRLLREKKGLTQEELANACDFEISQVSRIELGKVNPSISTIKKIASSLDTPLNELFNFEN